MWRRKISHGVGEITVLKASIAAASICLKIFLRIIFMCAEKVKPEKHGSMAAGNYQKCAMVYFNAASKKCQGSSPFMANEREKAAALRADQHARAAWHHVAIYSPVTDLSWLNARQRAPQCLYLSRRVVISETVIEGRREGKLLQQKYLMAVFSVFEICM